MKTGLMSTAAVASQHILDADNLAVFGQPLAVSIIGGLPGREQIAANLGCSERTVIRLEHQGMPVIKLGNLRLYNPDAVRAWIMAHERRHDVPKRGRPAKRAT